MATVDSLLIKIQADLGDLRKEHGDGKGHCNQEGHSKIAMRTAADVHEKWGIKLEINRDIEHLDLSGE